MSAPFDFAALNAARGYVILYRRHSGAACPSCGASNWIVGRSTAECARCHTALPLMEPVNAEHPITSPHERIS